MGGDRRTRGARSVRWYRRLTHLYPRSFRHEYRDDLVRLFEQQMQEGQATTVWLRTVRDLAVSVPVEHVDTLLHRSPYDIVAAVSATVAVTAALLALMNGRVLTAALGAATSVVAATLARWSWRVGRPFRAPGAVTAAWRLSLGCGVTCIAAGMSIATATHQNFGRFYWPWLMLSLGGLVLVACGLALGLGRAVVTLRRRHVETSG